MEKQSKFFKRQIAICLFLFMAVVCHAEDREIKVFAQGKTENDARSLCEKKIVFAVKEKVNEGLVRFLQENSFEDFSYDSVVYDISLETAEKSLPHAEFSAVVGEKPAVEARVNIETVFEVLKEVLANSNLEGVDFSAFTEEDLL